MLVMTQKIRKTEKISDLLFRVKECLENDAYRFTRHALDRKNERLVEIPDIVNVLLKGHQRKQRTVGIFSSTLGTML